jgi:hypothetical protein
MPLFMDVHTMGGPVTAKQAAGAHQADLATQGRYGVDYKSYCARPRRWPGTAALREVRYPPAMAPTMR